MKLNKLYSEPIGLFQNTPKDDGIIHFKSGVNFIFGKKDNKGDSKKSLNGIGKSLLLDLIDFCFLSSFDANRKPRLFEAREYLEGYKIVLEVLINGVPYTIKRQASDPSNIEFGETGKEEEYYIDDLKRILCDKIFKNTNYTGYYSNKKLRSLLPFYLKIHSSTNSKKTFSDPIKYLTSTSETEVNQYHLFLMGIDNTLTHKNYVIQEKISKVTPLITNVKKKVEEINGLDDIADLKAEIDSLERDISELEEKAKKFKLGAEYQNCEEEINTITSLIKSHVMENLNDSKSLESYRKSIDIKDDLKSINKVKKIYSDINKVIGEAISKTLDDAIEFRQKISKSRERFLSEEIQSLKENIEKRRSEIDKLEIKRAKLYEFLEAKKAMDDITKGYEIISDKKNLLIEYQGIVGMYNSLTQEKAEYKKEEKSIELEITHYLEEISHLETAFRNEFDNTFNKIYESNKNEAVFSFTDALRKKQKMSINVKVPAMRSEGKNQGRSLVYDLSMLIHGVKAGVPSPNFLIHDGIFDGVDKAHFVAACNYINSLSENSIDIQYIVPVNEEGTLSEKFGDVGDLTPDNISKEAIINLTPSKKLLGDSW